MQRGMVLGPDNHPRRGSTGERNDDEEIAAGSLEREQSRSEGARAAHVTLGGRGGDRLAWLCVRLLTAPWIRLEGDESNMRLIKLLGLVFAAVLAVSASAAIPANALTFKTTNALEHFKLLETKETKLETLGQSAVVKCSSYHILGFAHNLTDKALKVLLTFLGCTESAFNSSCTSKGQATGTVQTLDLHGLLVWLPGSPRKPGLLLLPEAKADDAEFTCDSGLVTFVVEGSVLGEYTEALNTLKPVFKFAFRDKTGETGMQQFTEWFETETGGTAHTGAHLSTTATGLLKFTKAESSEVGEGAVAPEHEGEIVK